MTFVFAEVVVTRVVPNSSMERGVCVRIYFQQLRSLKPTDSQQVVHETLRSGLQGMENNLSFSTSHSVCKEQGYGSSLAF